MLIDGPMSSRAGKHVADHPEEFINQQGRNITSFKCVTIGSLPDNVLLDIFDFHQKMAYYPMWHRLVQVCRRWRYVVFASPRRLGLKFLCRATTPVREILDASVWAPMQIVVENYGQVHPDGDNIVAALEHSERVCDISLSYLPSSLLERLATVMQPFPVLRHLYLHYYGRTPPVLPDTFLGGSAPCLESLRLSGVPFLALPKLLLSARDLVEIELWSVPRTGYISPEAMVTCLSTLTNLEFLTLAFQSPSSCPYRRSQRPPPETRIVLPTLTKLVFQGISEYLEDLLARIDIPVIRRTTTTFFNQDIFDNPHLLECVSCAETLEPFKHARLFYNDGNGRIDLHPVDRNFGYSFLGIGIRCDTFDSVERLSILYGPMGLSLLQGNIVHARWLDIFDPFIALQSLDVEPVLAPLIVSVLQELTGDRATEVLPALHSISLGWYPPGSMQQALDPFITARQLSGHPVRVVHE